jgi:hypothetical protein
MSKSKPHLCTRRSFLTAVPAVFAGSSFFKELSALSRPAGLQEIKAKLTEDEAALVKKSKMAQDLKNYFGEGYSCAESILMVSLRFLKLSEDHIWAAAGFGGGLGQRDLCGFLTGGYMGIGFAGGGLEGTRKEAKARCSPAFNEYWKWWQTQAPAECADILAAGYGGAGCTRLGLLASVKVEELVTKL